MKLAESANRLFHGGFARTRGGIGRKCRSWLERNAGSRWSKNLTSSMAAYLCFDVLLTISWNPPRMSACRRPGPSPQAPGHWCARHSSIRMRSLVPLEERAELFDEDFPSWFIREKKMIGSRQRDKSRVWDLCG